MGRQFTGARQGWNDLLWVMGQEFLRAQSGRVKKMGIYDSRRNHVVARNWQRWHNLLWLTRQEILCNQRERKETVGVCNGRTNRHFAGHKWGRMRLYHIR